MVYYKPYNTHKQAYAHAQRFGLQGLHNAASIIAHSHCFAFTTQDEMHTQGTRLWKKMSLTV